MTPCCSRAMCSAPHPLFANLNSAARSDLGCASSAMLLALTHLLPASAQKTPHVLGSFGFSSRMLLFRPAGTDRVPKPVILARFAAFFRGDWEPLLRAAIAGTSAPARPTTNTTDTDDLPRRLERATRLAHLGELSAARQALTSEPLAPPTEATLQQLTDPSRRPAEPYRPLPQDILDAAPDVPLALDRTALLANLRRARRGAAPGPSGYTAEILRLVLDEEDASQLFFEVASLLARAHVPESAVAGLALGRLVALSKPGEGRRGLVVGDFLRRLVARTRTIAQQFAADFEAACNPHQYALSTRAGAEALVHTLQARTQADPSLTLLSVDAAAAYDLVSREAMLTSLRDTPSTLPVLPFAMLVSRATSGLRATAPTKSLKLTVASKATP